MREVREGRRTALRDRLGGRNFEERQIKEAVAGGGRSIEIASGLFHRGRGIRFAGIPSHRRRPIYMAAILDR